MQQLFQDLRYAVRGLIKRPGFTFIAIAGLEVALRRAHRRRHFQPLRRSTLVPRVSGCGPASAQLPKHWGLG